MPEKIKALLVLLLIMQWVFFILKPVYAEYFNRSYVNKIKINIIIVSCSGFLISNYYYFSLFLLVYFLLQNKNTNFRVLLYFSSLPLLPVLMEVIRGFAGINYLIDLTYPRLLVIALLIPVYFSIKNSPKSYVIFSAPSDKYVIAYLSLSFILILDSSTSSDAFRQLFYLFVDIFIPYFVISRVVRDVEQFKICILALFTALLMMAHVAVFEAIKYWHLFSSMERELVFFKGSDYAVRSGMLRATASFYGPIVLGFMMNIALACLLILRDDFKSKKVYYFVGGVILVAMISSYSRGAWLGCGVLLGVYFIQGKNKRKVLANGLIAMVVMLIVLCISPVGEKLYQMLPFVGDKSSHAESTIDYRKKLFEQSLVVLYKKPFFGNINFIKDKDLQGMIQGEGIIDMVNSYLQISLSRGLVGLYFFIMIFYVNIKNLWQKKKVSKNEAYKDIISICIAIIIAMLTVIATTSLVGRVPIMLWVFSGLGTALGGMKKNNGYD